MKKPGGIVGGSHPRDSDPARARCGAKRVVTIGARDRDEPSGRLPEGMGPAAEPSDDARGTAGDVDGGSTRSRQRKRNGNFDDDRSTVLAGQNSPLA